MPRAIDEAMLFCKRKEIEDSLRGFIAEITSKLIRSNLSARNGLRYANLLFDAYTLLGEIQTGAVPATPVNTQELREMLGGDLSVRRIRFNSEGGYYFDLNN